MANKEFVHIDEVIKKFETNHKEIYEGDFSDFLSRLNNQTRKSIALDEVLTNQFQSARQDEPFSWRRILVIIWFRRIRNVSLLALTILSIGYSILWFYVDKPVSLITTQKSADKKPSPTMELDKIKGKVQQRNLTLAPSLELGKTEIPNDDNNFLIQYQFKEDESKAAPIQTLLNIIQEPILTKKQLKKPKQSLYSNTEELGTIVWATNLKKAILEKEIKACYINGAYILGLNLIGSYQTAANDMLTHDPKNINRNYAPLSNNGRESKMVFNYGFSIERSLYKGFGLSIGLQKLSIRQEQITNYSLNEVPVYDIDGNIAGYIGIPTQKINAKIVNKVDYFSVPFQLIYGVQLNNKSRINVKCGTSLLGVLNQRTEKFDYKSLAQLQYNNSNNRMGFNALQYGLYYSQFLKGKFMFSCGIERQNIAKIKPLSDATEKVKSISTNLILSLQYKL